MNKFRLTFFDKKTIIITQEEELRVKRAINEGVKFFTLTSGIFATSNIARIEVCKNEKFAELPEGNADPVKKETLVRLKKKFAKKFNWPDKSTTKQKI